MTRLQGAQWFVAPFLVVTGLLVLADAGFFDAVSERFREDGGSAKARLLMFDIFSSIPLRDLLFAPDLERTKAARGALGLDLGIENPVAILILYQGVLATAALTFGVAFYLRGITRRLQGRVAAPLLYFIILMMSFESLGTKSTLLAKFAVLMITMFRRQALTADNRQSDRVVNSV